MSAREDKTPNRMPLVVLPLALTYLAIAINLTIANVALPTISTELSASADQLAWIVNATSMTSAAFILFAGAWSDRVGRKRMLLVGIAIFLVAALLSGMTDSVEVLIVLRALTGLGSALAMPSALALTFAVTSGTNQRTAVGIMGGTQAIGALLGPLIGGAALVTFGWQAAFLSVSPLLALALIMNIIWLPKDEPHERIPLDNVGAALTAVAGVALLYAAVTAASDPGVGVWMAVVVGVSAGIALIWWERRVANPLFYPAIVKRRTFLIPTLTVFVVQFTLGGLMFLTMQYVQLVLGFSALAAGVFLMPALLMWTASSASAGLTAKRFGVRNVTAVSMVVTGVGLVVISSGGTSPVYPVLIVGLLLTGVMGLAPALMTHTSVSNYPEERRSIGSAVNGMAMRFGLAFGVAGYGTLLAVRYRSEMAPAVTSLAASDKYAATESLGGALNVARSSGPADLAQVAKDSFVAGFQTTLVVAAIVLAVLAVVVWRVLPARMDAGTANSEVQS